jgi:acyl carrier protein
MQQETIEHRVIRLIAKTQNIPAENIHLDQAIEEICQDSLDMVNLLFALEDEFNLSIPDEAKESKTIDDIIKGITTLLQQNEDALA